MICGVGLGLRWEFLDELLEKTPELAFLEVSPENYIGRGGYHRERLADVRRRYPIITHGLTMSLGGHDPLDVEYMQGLSAFIKEVGTPWHSDHVCWSSLDGKLLHDLLPVAFTRANVERIASRIREAQDRTGARMLVENISYYMHPGQAEMSEPEFLSELCDRADCGLMLDVNNAYVNSVNFGFNVDEWMAKAPLERTVQMHVAGHAWFEDKGREPARLIVDTHGEDVCDPVLALLGRVLQRTGPVPVLLERDQNIPSLAGLMTEVARVRAVYDAAMPSTLASEVAGLDKPTPSALHQRPELTPRTSP
jgi:hypothetical protein